MISVSGLLSAMNLIKPYNIFLRPEYRDKPIQFIVMAEKGFQARGYDCEGNHTNIMRFLNCDQNALKMLEGFDLQSKIGQLREEIGGIDDGIRGHFCVGGNLDSAGASFSTRFFFPYDISLGFYVPFYTMRLGNVVWHELTEDPDDPIKELLTDNFFAHVKELGCLNLCGWRRTGLGDITILAEWLRDFNQTKPFLKNVRLNGRFGINFPTGLKQSEDNILAFSFGNDGAWSLIFAGGLDLTLGTYFKTGFDVELSHIFGFTKVRRIKTNKCQTELLLLQKCMAYKDYALRQQFTLYVQLDNLFEGLLCKFGYQFFKHGEDTLSLNSNEISSEIANTAESLMDQTTHNFLFNIAYDFSKYMSNDTSIVPTVSCFAAIPFNGKRAVQEPFLGFMVALNF